MRGGSPVPLLAAARGIAGYARWGGGGKPAGPLSVSWKPPPLALRAATSTSGSMLHLNVGTSTNRFRITAVPDVEKKKVDLSSEVGGGNTTQPRTFQVLGVVHLPPVNSVVLITNNVTPKWGVQRAQRYRNILFRFFSFSL